MRVQSKAAVTMTALLSMTALAASGCKSEHDGKPSATVAAPTAKAPGAAGQAAAAGGETASTTLTIDRGKSSIGFVGRKVTLDHSGSFGDFSGTVTMKDGKQAAVRFTVQTASVAIEPENLKKHLKSADFFDVASHPTATFASTAITEGAQGGTHTVTGNFTLRGTTKQISFPATIKVDGGTAHGRSEFKINRKDFGIVYPGQPDDLIADEVLLKLDLHFAGG